MRMRRSLDNVAEASSFPSCLKRGEGDEEKTVAKKSQSREVFLIRDIVLRFFGRRRLRPSAKNATKKPSRRLAVRGWRCTRARSRVPPSSKRSAYRFAGGPIRTAHMGR
ncbi:hypothetical protein BHE74_00001287 [Ensete ventricosum]|nr:hypothetical protein BHE74_00001287 [Ensete ventricosum]